MPAFSKILIAAALFVGVTPTAEAQAKWYTIQSVNSVTYARHDEVADAAVWSVNVTVKNTQSTPTWLMAVRNCGPFTGYSEYWGEYTCPQGQPNWENLWQQLAPNETVTIALPIYVRSAFESGTVRLTVAGSNTGSTASLLSPTDARDIAVTVNNWTPSAQLLLPPLSSYAPSVTPKGTTSQVPRGLSMSKVFTVQNTGSLQATYALAASCGTMSNCRSLKQSMTLSPGAMDNVSVTYMTPSAAGVSNVVKLRATYTDANSQSIADTGTVTIVTQGVSPSVTPKTGAVTVVSPYNPFVTFYVTNNGTLSTAYTMTPLCEGWPIGCFVSSMTLSPEYPNSYEVVVRFSVPSALGSASQPPSAVRLIARLGTAADTGTIPVALPYAKPVITPHATSVTDPAGTTRFVSFSVRNSGNVAGLYFLSSVCPGELTCSLSTIIASLDPGATATVTSIYTAPPIGQSGTVKLIVNKIASPSLEADTAQITTTGADLIAPTITLDGIPVEGGATDVGAQSISIRACDVDGTLLTPTVVINGTTLSPVFTSGSACRSMRETTLPFVAAAGANTVTVSVSDGPHVTTQVRHFTYNESAEARPIVTALTPSQLLRGGQQWSDTFAIRNAGPLTVSYSLAADCTGGAATCAPSVPSISVGPGQTVKMAVNFTAPTAWTVATVRPVVTYLASNGTSTIVNDAYSLISLDQLAPTAVIVGPAPGSTIATFPSVSVAWCDGDGSLTSHTLTLDGVLLQDTFMSETRPGCTTAGTSTWPSVALTLGAHTLTATATDVAGHVTASTLSFTFGLPAIADFQPQVTPRSATMYLAPDVQTWAFAVRNTGNRSAQYQIASDCASLAAQLTPSGCQVDRATLALAAGAVDTVRVTFTLTALPTAQQAVSLTASYTDILGRTAQHTASVNGLVPTFAQLYQPYIAQSDVVIPVRMFSVSLFDVPITNLGVARATYRMSVSVTAPFELRNVVDSITVDAGQTAIYQVQPASFDPVVGRRGTVTLTASYTTAGSSISATATRTIEAGSGTGGGGGGMIKVIVTPTNGLVPVTPFVERTYPFVITNSGAGLREFAYTVHCSAADGGTATSSVTCADVAGQTTPLGAGQSQTINARFTGTTTDRDGLVTVRVTSTDGSATSVGTIRTWLAPQGRIAVTTRRVNGENAIERSACVTIAAGADAAYQCGDLQLAHVLPATTTMNKTRAPTLVYSSRHAQGIAYVAADVAVQSGTPLEDVRITLKVKDATGVDRVDTSRTVRWLPQWSTGEPHRFVMGFNAASTTLMSSGQTAGAFAYRLEVRSLINTEDVAVDEGVVIVVDRSASRFGRGWWLAGLEQLVIGGPDTSMRVWIAGDGSARIYKKQSPGVWTVDAPVDRPDTLTSAGFGYRRLLSNGAYVEFDYDGRHVLTRNAQGHLTRFEWDANPARLREIRLPVPSSSGISRWYVFSYDANGSRLTAVTAPPTTVARQVLIRSVGAATGFAIDTIIDPDGHAVAFEVDQAKRVRARRDRAGYRTEFAYDEGGALRSSTTFMAGTGEDITHTFCAAETASLTSAQSPCVDGVSPSINVRTLYDGPRSVADAVDQTSFYVDRFGAPRSVVNALGQTTQIERSDTKWPLLATAVVSPRLHRVEAKYDPTSGLLVSQIATNPYDDQQPAKTDYKWKPTPGLRLLDEITSPTQERTKFGYFPSGDREWQQDGRGDSTQVTFAYNADRQVIMSAAPGNRTTSYHYDAAGNIDSTTSPMGFASRTYRDAIGRDTLSITPTDSAQSPSLRTRVRTTYDIMDRVRIVETVAPPVSYVAAGTLQTASGQTLIVEHDYDAEGNLLSVVRRDAGDLNLATGWTYDGAGRKLTENTSGIPNVYRYDAAGNLRFHTTPRSVTIEQTFDALNRLKTRTTPGQTFAQTTCHPGTWNLTRECIGTQHFFPKFGTSVAIPTDVSVFDYDDDGNLIRADNRDAQIRRTYYSGGALKTDTLKARRYTDDGLTGDDLYAESKTTLAFTYDLAGRRTSLTTNSVLGGCGPCVQSYAHVPGFGALESVTAPGGQTFTYRYDRLGQPYRFESPSNVTTWQYDDDGRVRGRSQSAPGLFHQEAFSYDARGKSTLVSAQRTASAPITVVSVYDALGALVMTNTANAGAIELEEWTVDALANALTYRRNRHSVATTSIVTSTIDQSTGRLERTDPVVPPFLADGQRQSASQQDYDNSGNVRWTAAKQTVVQGGAPRDLDANVYTMSWYGGDEKLRVYQRVGVDTTPGLASAFEEYRYDALGRRVLMSSRPFPTCGVAPCLHVVDYYVWDGDQLLLERRRGTNASGAIVSPSQYTGTVVYVHGLELDQPLALIKDGDEVIQPQRDWRGHFDGGLTLSGQAATQGVTWPGGNLSAYLLERTPAQSLGWRGSLIQGKKDPSGLIYMRNRYYDPASGRFTQQDPIGLAGGVNLYGFADGDPVNSHDPFGLCPPCYPDQPGGGFRSIGASGSDAMRGAAILGAVTAGGLAMMAAPAVPAMLMSAGLGPAIPRLSDELAATFEHGKYVSMRLATNLPTVRVFDGVNAAKVGRWFTPNSPGGSAAAQGALNLVNNAATFEVQAIIPSGTSVYMGQIAGSTTNAIQVFVPRAVDVVKFGSVKVLPP